MSSTLPPLAHRPAPAQAGSRRGRPTATHDRPADVAARWERPALLVLLASSLLLYLWNLSREGWANTYYAAAVQAGTQSGKAFLFGSLDAANAITVDKPPFSLWVMEIPARIVGLNSWSMLVPQAVAGVLTVLAVNRTVRRVSGPVPALLAGLAMACTPVAALIFRYNNPDAVLTLLMAAAAYTLVRGLEDDRLRWVIATGGLLGAAFLTKSLQAFLVLPAFAAVWMVAGDGTLVRRAGRVATATAVMAVAGGWWVAMVELWPAGSRPYIGGSTGNSAWELIWGYNGLERLSASTGVGGGPGGGFSGTAGWGRLFNDVMGGQIAWLLPLAAAGLIVGLVLRGRAPRTDLTRAHYLMWGGWVLTHAVVFSAMTGTIHAYYTVAMAPAIAALVGMGVQDMWDARREVRLRWVLPTSFVVTGLLGYTLLERSPDFHPWLKWLVVLGTVGGAVATVVHVPSVGRRLAVGGAAVAMTACLLGPAAYALDTAASAHSGGNPLAGPATSGGMGGVGNRGGGFPGGGTPPQGAPGGQFTPPTGAQSGQLTPPTGTQGGQSGTQGGQFTPPTGTQDGQAAPASGGVPGSGSANQTLITYLTANQGSARWIAATNSANAAAPLQLAAGRPVMAIGGFTGSDPAPTLEQFIALVKAGTLRFYVTGGGMGGGGMGGQGGGSSISSWVQQNGTLVSSSLVGGATVYDLSGAAS